MPEGQDPAVAAVLTARIAEVTDRLLRDCIALGAPVPEFIVRVGRERVDRFDERYPHLTEQLLAHLDPEAVYIHISVPPDHSSTGVRCTPGRTIEEICADAAEALQELLIEGELWGAAWPPCPAHRVHPLWPELLDGIAVWRCDTGPQYRIPVGELPADR